MRGAGVPRELLVTDFAIAAARYGRDLPAAYSVSKLHG